MLERNEDILPITQRLIDLTKDPETDKFDPARVQSAINFAATVENLSGGVKVQEGLKFSDEELEAFVPTAEDRAEWQELYGINDSTD